ncbi:hypothetical protein [Streptomyces sp. STCH 565 A]|uniref:hypothetical protein n=1 Tax=Streptomyces sp. STCH 565 A TaxID=2950532 RepID=UPI002075698B|nr:hypothetical protein [Streptomyces sp. STCH 565 A]MCM8555367.1 hypothetical protein [Streptomyces sp. STCH 565 A]
MKLRAMIAAIATVGVLTLTACTTTEPSSDPVADTIADQPAPDPQPAPETGIDADTRDAFTLTWAIATEPQRDAYCTSVAILPPDLAAAEMQAGAGGSTDLDWMLMVDLLKTECASR